MDFIFDLKIKYTSVPNPRAQMIKGELITWYLSSMLYEEIQDGMNIHAIDRLFKHYLHYMYVVK